MIPLPAGLSSLGSRLGSHFSSLRSLVISKPARTLFVSISFLLTLFTLRGYLECFGTCPKARLHLLVPATSSNEDLCKLMLSAQILGYPTPTLINFGATEAEDAYVQHLAKVEGILNYLTQFETTAAYSEELVLIADGYDVWFQLPPEVLLRRYFQLNSESNEVTRHTYGNQVAMAHDMRQTIIFGPDKICWPVDYSRPACWAIPNAALPEYAFGPHTTQVRDDFNLPRWLNSGTIIGPLQDLKILFEDTLKLIRQNHTTDSDQFYMAELFGLQEFNRLKQSPARLQHYKKQRLGAELSDINIPIERSNPALFADQAEYHVGIDYGSRLFQTVAFYKQYITWMRPIDSWLPRSTPLVQEDARYSFLLPEDVKKASPPFAALTKARTLASHTWAHVELLYNTATGQTPVLIHFTGDKHYRQLWWQRLWFQSRAKELREAQMRHNSGGSIASVGGYRWYNYDPEQAEGVDWRGLGGAYSDGGEWLAWDNLCTRYELDFYELRGDHFNHPSE